MAWITVLNLLLLVKLFILLDGGTEARDAVIDRLALTTEQIDASGEVFEDQKAKDHKIFRSVRLREFVASGIWYGAAVGICVVGVLLSTIRWWNRVIPPKNAGIQYPSKQVVGWIFAIAFVGLFIRLPRMDFSLYNDESFNFTRYIHGQFKPDKETGELKFRKVSWQQTAWGNHFGNNGELYSIAARASHDFWQKQNNTADGEVSEVALRIPSLLAGVGSIIIISLCGVLCFGTRTGIIAAILTALHPWHIRYSTEARSYGMVLLFSAIILLSLVLAIREGRWRWWLLFSFNRSAVPVGLHRECLFSPRGQPRRTDLDFMEPSYRLPAVAGGKFARSSPFPSDYRSFVTSNCLCRSKHGLPSGMDRD